MANGYNILWTENALTELENTFHYIETNWTRKELKNLSENIEKTIFLLSINPLIFPLSYTKKDVRRVVVMSLNTIYYRVVGNQVEILSFFSNRQNPNKIKL